MKTPPVMPWGKHKNQPLAEIPGSYLFWVIESCENVDDELMCEIKKELASRLPAPPLPTTRHIIDRDWLISWCRRAALRCHPDHGGSIAMMKLVNELRSTL